MLYRFIVDVPLRWVDVDSEGVVNNAVYLSLVEQARFLYFEELGLLQNHRVEFLLAEVTVKYLRPARLGMQTKVAAAVTKLGNTSFQMRYEVQAGEQVLAKAEAALVYVDEVNKPRPIPDAVRETISSFEGLDED